ncbi:unnamed protein product [Closterium sp. NIES-64]|nr:unnamed protein product [Closterium sp. NIES-64]
MPRYRFGLGTVQNKVSLPAVCYSSLCFASSLYAFISAALYAVHPLVSLACTPLALPVAPGAASRLSLSLNAPGATATPLVASRVAWKRLGERRIKNALRRIKESGCGDARRKQHWRQQRVDLGSAARLTHPPGDEYLSTIHPGSNRLSACHFACPMFHCLFTLADRSTPKSPPFCLSPPAGHEEHQGDSLRGRGAEAGLPADGKDHRFAWRTLLKGRGARRQQARRGQQRRQQRFAMGSPATVK